MSRSDWQKSLYMTNQSIERVRRNKLIKYVKPTKEGVDSIFSASFTAVGTFRIVRRPYRKDYPVALRILFSFKHNPTDYFSREALLASDAVSGLTHPVFFVLPKSYGLFLVPRRDLA